MIEVSEESTCLKRKTHLSQRLRLDLADPLARQVHRLADLGERVLASPVDAVAHAYDVLLAFGEYDEELACFSRQPPRHGRIEGKLGIRILESIADTKLTFAADRASRLIGTMRQPSATRTRSIESPDAVASSSFVTPSPFASRSRRIFETFRAVSTR